ncbi:hypothetical protein BKA62DRAFT_691016 [Auriculariales sp. MPI-PUGE-AT-0066]|nr:hypothetical protein BKA62DRAFT_691016 [Auriculariales sp. MPI-PUGE-AT-0066]
MLVRISRRSALHALHAARAGPSRYTHSTTPRSAQQENESTRPALDVIDTHLLSPNSALNASSARTALEDVAQKLQLPLGGATQAQDVGLEPPAVLEQPAPETRDATTASLSEQNLLDRPSPAEILADREVEESAEPVRPSQRRMVMDSPIGMTNEESPSEYNDRRFKVIIVGGKFTHMAVVFTVVRELERIYGRIAHFHIERDFDIPSQYINKLIVTFKHRQTKDLITMTETIVDIREPLRMDVMRDGGVGFDELDGLLDHEYDEWGQRGRDKRAADALRGPDVNEADEFFEKLGSLLDVPPEGLRAANVPQEPNSSATTESRDTVGLPQTEAGSAEAAPPVARTLDEERKRNLPKIGTVRISQYNHPLYKRVDETGYVMTKLNTGHMEDIGRLFSEFRGFHPDTASSTRMQRLQHKWKVYQPVNNSDKSWKRNSGQQTADSWKRNSGQQTTQTPEAAAAPLVPGWIPPSSDPPAPAVPDWSPPAAPKVTPAPKPVVPFKPPTWERREAILTPQQEAYMASERSRAAQMKAKEEEKQQRRENMERARRQQAQNAKPPKIPQFKEKKHNAASAPRPEPALRGAETGPVPPSQAAPQPERSVIQKITDRTKRFFGWM